MRRGEEDEEGVAMVIMVRLMDVRGEKRREMLGRGATGGWIIGERWKEEEKKREEAEAWLMRSRLPNRLMSLISGRFLYTFAYPYQSSLSDPPHCSFPKPVRVVLKEDDTALDVPQHAFDAGVEVEDF